MEPCHRIGPLRDPVDDRIGVKPIDSVIDSPYCYSQTDWRQHQEDQKNPCEHYSKTRMVRFAMTPD